MGNNFLNYFCSNPKCITPYCSGCEGKGMNPKDLSNIGLSKEIIDSINTIMKNINEGEYNPPNVGPAMATMLKPKKKHQPKLCLECKEAICEVCGICETLGCRFQGKKILTPDQLSEVRHLMAKTQKARGFVALAEMDTIRVPTPYRVFGSREEIVGINTKSLPNRLFARPCPIRPRHGFVESRGIDKSDPAFIDKLTEIWEETVKADPESELLLTPRIDAKFNMILTPTRMAVGTGHDGATAGKNGSIALPLLGVKFSEINNNICTRAGVDLEKDDPYIEAVMDGGLVYFTQLRAGVKIPPTVGEDFIPHTMRVMEVIEASGDLMEWEKQVQNIKEGTVVYHIGGTLISHYGVHCMYNNIPILTSRIPEIGDIIVATPAVKKPNPDDVIKGLMIGSSMKVTYISTPNLIKSMLVIAHNAGAMGGRNGMWLGVAAMIMMRAGMAASHGEARHAKDTASSRGEIYKCSFEDFFASREELGKAQWLFLNHNWPSGSFGGKAWAACTKAIIELDQRMRELITNKTDEAVSALVTKLNEAINQAHNGGWWLNKFVHQRSFDGAAMQSMITLVEAGPGLITIMEEVNTIQNDMILNSVNQWNEVGDIIISKPVYAPSYDSDNDDPPEYYDDPPDDEGNEDSNNGNDPNPKDEITLTPEAIANVLPPDSKFIGSVSKFLKKSKSPIALYNALPNVKKQNVNLNEVLLVPPYADITVIQGRYIQSPHGSWCLHVQYRVTGILGYYSIKLLVNSVPHSPYPSNHKYYSFAKSEEVYYPMTAVHVKDSIWRVTEPVNDNSGFLDIALNKFVELSDPE